MTRGCDVIFEQTNLSSDAALHPVARANGVHERTILDAYRTILFDGDDTAVRAAFAAASASSRSWSELRYDDVRFVYAALEAPGATADLNDPKGFAFPRPHVNLRVLYETTMFHVALMCSDSLDVAVSLMTAGARLDTVGSIPVRGCAPLMLNPFQLAVVRYEPTLNGRRSDGFEIVKYMVERGGADPTTRDRNGWNAGHYAMIYQQYSAAELEWFAEKGVRLDGDVVGCDTPLHVAVLNGEKRGQELLAFWTTMASMRLSFNNPGRYRQRLNHALMTRHLSIDDVLAVLRVFKDAGAESDAPDDANGTPATIALEYYPGEARAFYGVLGDAVNYRRLDRRGRTTLWSATGHRDGRPLWRSFPPAGAVASFDDVEFLLERGVDPKWLDDDGSDVLSAATHRRYPVLAQAGVACVYRVASNRRVALYWANMMTPLTSASSAPIAGHDARNLLNGPGPGHDGDDAVKRSILRMLLEMGARTIVRYVVAM